MTAPQKLKCVRGVALLEFTIAVPALLILIFGGIDLGRMFAQYLTMQSIVNVGLRVAQGTPGLQPNLEVTNTMVFTPSCAPQVAAGLPASNLSVNARMAVAVCALRTLNGSSLDSIEMSSLYFGPAAAAPRQNAVRVVMRAQYLPINTIFFPSIPMATQASGPYLS